MQISQRAKNIQPSATLALSTRANAMRAEGIDVINLTVRKVTDLLAECLFGCLGGF